MARRRTIRSLSVPIVLASITVPLSIALLVGWTLLVVQNQALPQNVWLLVLGALSFVLIMTVLVMFSIFLVREVLEVRRQDMFIDSVTHELKSPLASLKLCLQTMEREGIDEEQRQSLREMMLDDVDRLSSFIDDVLQASRLAHDRVGLDLSEVAVADLVERCAEGVVMRENISREDIHVDVEEGLSLYTDRAALELVVKNLVDNAVKYSGDPPRVDVIVRGDEDRGITIEVRDNGIGIPKKHIKRVFHRFYRVKTERVRARRGTGLGLFVVSALVRNLGGRVTASSEGEGQGSTFHVWLPRPQQPEAAGEPAPQEAAQ